MTRSQLLRTVKNALQERGYRSAPGTNFGATALMFKRLNRERPLLVLVAIQFSRVFDDAFTGYLCVSRSLRWAYRPTDCPNEMNTLIADHLSPDERALLLDDEMHDADDILRGWWRGFRETNAHRFIEAIDTCEPRLLAREQLLRQIEDSQILERWSNLRKGVLHLQNDSPQLEESSAETDPGLDKRYSGLRSDLIHDGWMHAAERVAERAGSSAERSTAFIRNLAQETWTLHRSGFNVESM